jgi:glyoxylase-like metal-dependent hydrolase (beta-lactamase superfamily II)
MNSATQSRRALLKNVCTLAGLGAAGSLFPIVPVSANEPAQAKTSPKEQGKELILLGTQGGPGVNLARSETASALAVGDQIYLVDCGYGTLRALIQAGLDFNRVFNIFLTHLHNDHTADVAALLSHKWTSVDAKPATVHGPFGTAELVDAAVTFFKADTEIRIVDEGRTAKPGSLRTSSHPASRQLSRIC